MASTISRPSITDDDGSGTTGTIDDANFWDSVFDAIDAMFSGAGAYATLALGGAVSTAGTVTIVKNGATDILATDSWNTNTTNNSTILHRFSTKDAGGTDRVAGYYGMRITDHSSGAIVANHEWLNKSGATLMTLQQTGRLVLTENIEIPVGSVIYWSGRSTMGSATDGLMTFTNQAGTAGATLRFSTDGRLEARNRANSDFADLYAKDGVFTGTVTAPSFDGVATGNLVGLTVGGDGAGTYTTITSITVNSDGLVSDIEGS